MTDAKKDLEIPISDQVRAQMDADAALKAALTELVAIFHQAQQAVDEGRYLTFDDAMFALTGQRPVPVDPFDDVDEDDDGGDDA